MCKICRGYGYITAYHAPHVVREYCKCNAGQKIKNDIIKQATKEPTPVWELFSL